MNWSRNIIILLITLFSCNLAFSQGEILLKVQPDTNIILIGDQIELTVSVEHPKGIHMGIPFLQDYIDQNIEVVESTVPDTLAIISNIVKLQQKYKLTAFDTGFYQIPPMPFEIHFGNNLDTLFSNPIPIGVLTLQLDTTNNIFDIKSQQEMPFTLAELLKSKWLLLWIAALIIAVLVVIIIKLRKKPEGFKIISKPQIPAHVVAIKELDALKAKKLWQQNEVKEYYSRLTNIIRNYIELRFHIKALEQTSSEILSEFEKLKTIDGKQVEHLSQLLALADLVKFAKGTALPDENERNMESAYEFVKNTKASPETQEESEQSSEVTEVIEPNKDQDKNA